MRRNLVLITALLVFLAFGGCGKPAVEITAPESANAGSEISISWTGTVAEGDKIVVRAIGATEGTEVEAVANSASVTLPLEDGAFEIVYMNAEGEAVATKALTINANTYTFEFPEEVIAGSWFEVAWTGPDNASDYITIVPEGAAEGEWLSYSYTADGSPVQIQAPLEPGVYEVRYSTEQVYPNPTLFSKTITVISTDYAVMAPAEITAGSDFQVAWLGADNPGDYITIVPVGTPEGEWLDYDYTVNGNPCTITAPAEPGEYEVRYSSEQVTPNPTLATTHVTVIPAEITLTAPESVPAGSAFEVTWTGPNGAEDYLTIVPAGSPEGTYTSYAYTSSGSPLSLDAPATPGEYEIWYASDRVAGTFASIPITVE